MPESNVHFGTAFPQSADLDGNGSVDSGKFVPVWKQEARDDRGRRRFHGAFKGGFSAGYFNTVGSKEGWTPSQFVSSRSARQERQSARPEDFMDEEDLQELASTKRLALTEEFDLHADAPQLAATGGSETLSVLVSGLAGLVAPVQESIGMKLLQAMGWRQGQGIGPRITPNDEDQLSETSRGISFAPEDTPVRSYHIKVDSYGLGYDVAVHVPQVAEMRRYQRQQSDYSTKKTSQSAFDAGVFEDDEEMTPYDDDRMEGVARQGYHHVLYDDNEDTLVLHQNQQKMASIDRVRNSTRCLDGHPPLNGYHVSKVPYDPGKLYAPLPVPDSFVEHRVGARMNVNAPRSRDLTIDARGAVLGEETRADRSVFDYISVDAKAKLQQAKNKVEVRMESIKKPKPVDKSLLRVALVPKSVADLALRGFIPFGDNPDKQARYRHYLQVCSKAEQSSDTTDQTTTFPIPPGMTFDAGMKEIDEFIKSAKIFRPISSMMSSRFTTASSDAQAGSASSGSIEQVVFEGGLKSGAEWKQQRAAEQRTGETTKELLSEQAEAASMGMFGKLTRTSKPFYPNRLVCKRFNVRNPHQDHAQGHATNSRTQAGSSSVLSDNVMASMMTEAAANDIPSNSNDPLLSAVVSKPSLQLQVSDEQSKAEQDEVEAADDQDEVQYQQRPPIDVFKSIFDTSNSEDESEDEVLGVEHQPAVQSQVELQNAFIGPPMPATKSHIGESDHQVHPTTRSLQSEEYVVAPFKSRLDSNHRLEDKDQEPRRRERHKHAKRKREDEKQHGRSSGDKKHKKKKESDRKRRHRHQSPDRRSHSRVDLNDPSFWVEKN
ncbi:hypothetical protein BC940DRAFT_350868 [Gongronella butleri]|nr:hypothetical protein BC940DRAFT_350868 [Gongronella butleri]